MIFGLQLIDLIAILVYFVAIIIIGFWASRRIKSQEDYFLGGRKFGKFVQTFAAFGQGTSSETAVGMTVIVSRNGVAGILQQLVGIFHLPFFWITSLWYRRLRTLTLGDFFEERFNSKGLAAFYALNSVVFFMIVIGLGFSAMTKTITGIAAKPVEQYTPAEKLEYGRALILEKLEGTDIDLLSGAETLQLEQLRIENPNKQFSVINEKWLIWIVAFIVIIYAVFGGLEAAFLTDTLQGIFILILSLLLLPFAFMKINHIYGGSGLSGIIETIRSQLPQSTFEIWGSPALVDFTWYYLLALIFVIFLTVAVQANQLVACGSAKDESTARFGFTTGMLIKRAATLIWGISAILLVVLYGSTVNNPDYLWGHACRDLLGPLNLGLVGLMIACLMAAVMSTADALMITSSSLLTRNFFRPIFPNLPDKAYIRIGRITGLFVVIGGVLIANQFDNVFQMIKLIWEFNIVLAAGYWLGMKWRRANRKATWWSMSTTMILFIVLQVVVPLIPGVKTNEHLLATVESVECERIYTARETDVQNRLDEIEIWNLKKAKGIIVGQCPETITEGQKFSKTFSTPRKSIFWTQGIKTDENGYRYGSGFLSLELVLLNALGIDLTRNPYALNETIRLLIRTVWPFLILIIISLLTSSDNKTQLDRFFVKMKTPVVGDRENDVKEMELSYANTNRFDHKKMFRNSNWEFEKLDKTDIKGMVWLSIAGAIIFGLLFLVSLAGK
ncbi:MAG: sodium:solute symporter [Prolixibacteraceae bacterium]